MSARDLGYARANGRCVCCRTGSYPALSRGGEGGVRQRLSAMLLAGRALLGQRRFPRRRWRRGPWRRDAGGRWRWFNRVRRRWCRYVRGWRKSCARLRFSLRLRAGAGRRAATGFTLMVVNLRVGSVARNGSGISWTDFAAWSGCPVAETGFVAGHGGCVARLGAGRSHCVAGSGLIADPMTLRLHGRMGWPGCAEITPEPLNTAACAVAATVGWP